MKLRYCDWRRSKEVSLNLRKIALPAILMVLCGLQQGSAADQKQQVTVLKYVVPPYPAIARTSRIQGDVILNFNVLSDGTVLDVEVFRGPKYCLKCS